MDDQTKKFLFNAGYFTLKGAMTYLALIIVGGMAFIFISDWLWPKELDGTDMGLTQRSGVVLVTDYGTGCQYLMSPHSGLTPRMNPEGGHICNGAKK